MPSIISIVLSFLIFLFPSNEASASISYINSVNSDISLPDSLSQDDSFDDLPFEQLRQALREEVEHESSRNLKPRSFKRYNFLIR